MNCVNCTFCGAAPSLPAIPAYPSRPRLQSLSVECTKAIRQILVRKSPCSREGFGRWQQHGTSVVVARAHTGHSKDAAPPLSDSDPNTETKTDPDYQASVQSQSELRQASVSKSSVARIVSKRLLRRLSSLPLAIAEMGIIAALSAVGTIIEQNKPIQFYIDNYPDGDQKVLGFLTYDWILYLGLDRIYTAPYFLALMALLAASLAACTTTRQWPTLRVARRWRFARSPAKVHAAGMAQVLPNAHVRDLAQLLGAKGYQVFVNSKGSLYAFKGLAGRVGPIGVHASMLAIMAGVAWGGLSGWKGSAMVPQGGEFLIADALRGASPVARLPGGGAAVIHVDKFDIDYREDGSERQFSSDLSVIDPETGAVLSQQQISVNKPLRWQGVTAYQTDWSVSTLVLRAKGSPVAADNATPISLPMASLEGQPGVSGRLWATFLPAESPSEGAPGVAPRGVSILARDMQSVAIYDSNGDFVGIRRPDSGKPIMAEGMEIVIVDMVGATGLELKSDPGVPYVYAGFAGMMITTLVSYLSHSQVWALQKGSLLHVGSKTNRATFAFETEIAGLLDAMPERLSEAPKLIDETGTA